MTPPLEHDYIGLSEAAATAAFPANMKLPDQVAPAAPEGDILKETELTLGFPGSGSTTHSEERVALSLGLMKGPYGSGAKRVFSDAIDGSEKWAFQGRDGSDEELGKGGDLFSPRSNNVSVDSVLRVKDSSGTVAKAAAQDKKEEGSGEAMDPPAKTQVVGWPPIRSYRKNTMAATTSKNNDDAEDKQGSGSLYVKVSMDGAPYLRKVDLKIYCNYKELSSSLEKMFTCFTIGQCGSRGMPGKDGYSESRLTDCHGSEYVLTYEDKDGDWMLVGDVPWGMFTETCKRLRIMKGSEAIGLAPRTAEKRKSRNVHQHP